MSVGFALAERMLAAEFGDDLVDHHTYVIAGDGCLMEGVSHEAIDLAGHLKLNKLIVLFDDNGITIDGHTDLATSVDQVARFKAAGWNAERVDGLDQEEVAAAIERAQQLRQAVDDRLQDHHRLWRADQGRQPRLAWLGARRDRRSPAPARSSAGPIRPSRSRTTSPPPGTTPPSSWVGEREAWEARFAALDHDVKSEFKRRFDRRCCPAISRRRSRPTSAASPTPSRRSPPASPPRWRSTC